MKRTICILAPHPDDEVLGVGGTLARYAAEGHETHVVVVTKGGPPRYSAKVVETSRREAALAHAVLGIHATHFLGLPAAELDRVPHGEVNAAIGRVLQEIGPDELFLPFIGDIHLDHQLTFLSALVACRPHGQPFPAVIRAYETLSETNWNAAYLTPPFVPNHYVDISAFLDTKLKALGCFAGEMRAFPHERSLEAVRALAMHRGATVGRSAAEAFVTVRSVI